MIWLLQVTVGSTHPIPLGGLVHAACRVRQGKWADAEVRLAFVLPMAVALKYVSKHQALKADKGNAAAPARSWYNPKTMKWVQAMPRGREGCFRLEEAKAEAAEIAQHVWVWPMDDDLTA